MAGKTINKNSKELIQKRNGIKWNKEETILAFDLYCRTPFGKIGQSNPNIVDLAKLLGRTPGSVCLKMHNLAHYDPELKSRNIVAMAHGSKLDAEIYIEFSGNWAALSCRAKEIKEKMQQREVQEWRDIEKSVSIPRGNKEKNNVDD